MKLTESKLRQMVDETIEDLRLGEDFECNCETKNNIMMDAVIGLEVFVDQHSGDVPMDIVMAVINTLKNTAM